METTIRPLAANRERLWGYPMPPVYRPARPEDLAASDALVVASINELTVRHGFGPMAMPSPPSFQLFSLKDDPDGLWLAEEGGEIVGFAWSWVCGDVWFLAQLFVDPGRQGQGIGNALLERTLAHARKSGAAHKALITFTFNRVSQGLYIRHGLFPKMPVYFFSAERERLRRTLPQVPLRAVAIDNSAGTMANLGAIDCRAIGVSREKHHRYLFDDPAITGLLLHAGNDLVGYCYVGVNGHIGPLAVKRADVLHDAFAAALTLAADGSAEKISAFLPGTCDSALSLAVDQGMRISFPMLLMASPGYGDWTQYLPRNPGFM
ncbi:UNVERIFIED_ORG: GNAT superfamily N-acetyltransferase [Rhizobium esperanzae]|uniref:GCN5-related N-acetyltransferase protein n=3 Tax=Rhizobium TaxID=379 RepID=A0ABM6CCW1_9HYPH|nr:MULTISPECIES: GNAT family N-acetyltransferase [Rhizobium]MDH6646530.1 GNAT superfamily N-acetyltransferase [Rhizobium esperanzae]ANL41713.1 GCN5-related N-acetyltransferase protein [Rhizobium phaseoli]ANL60700.1 GCN5-related N-acetyltransferase protein [Rhizobium phaseoli]ANL86064.1 GCN5-related N-acetyltransferase protein [Rhizobium phaseoli]ANL92573.1 GCN5-related N-acetyltransferase protein [Rhizobium phaseoli]